LNVTASLTLDRLQHSVVSLLYDQVHLHDPVTPLDFTLAGSFPGRFYACIAAPENVDEPVSLVFTLPKYGRTVFLGLTRSKAVEVARVLANLEDLERDEAKSLKAGETIGFGQTSVAEAEFPPAAVILLPVSTSDLLSGLPDETALVGEQVRLLLAIPLSQRELRCRNETGHDALIDLFQREGKSLYFA
jgi:Suppressor of fused protein (SUFU)